MRDTIIMPTKKKRTEAVLLSFKIVLDTKGVLWTEVGGLPEYEVRECFKNKEDTYLIEKLIKEGRIKLDKINKYLENELTAITYVN
tara:strand:- start:5 stop:262 length:258 start_codon:yes stop_codon:yes gene_type:complete